MVPTTSAPRGMGYEQSLYRGLAQSQLAVLQNQMRLGNLNMGRRVVELANGVVIECVICFNRHDIYVHIPPAAPVAEEIVSVVTGLILHPRSGQIIPMEYRVGSYDAMTGTSFDTRTYPGVSGGWTNGITPITTTYLFPMVDDDNASFILAEDADGVVSGLFAEDASSYGNLYWWDGSIDTPAIVSWKGTPTRHFPLGGLYDIPGFTQQWCMYEHPITGDAPHYTAFSTNVYKRGVAVAAPRFSWPYDDKLDKRCLIVGAAVQQGQLIIAAISARRNKPQAVVFFSDGTMAEGTSVSFIIADNIYKTPTYSRQWDAPYQVGDDLWFVQLWRQGVGVDGWQLLAEAPCAEAEIDLPWFADKTGTQFTCSNGSTLTADGYTKASQDTGLFEMAVDDDNQPASVSVAGEYAPFSEGEETVSVTYNVSGSTRVTQGEVVYKDFSDDTIPWLGEDPEVSLSGPSVLAGTGSYPNITVTAGQAFTANGGTAPFTWSASFNGTASGATFTTTGGDKPCGMGTITVTDACGKTASLQVKMPNGQWVKVYGATSVPGDLWPNITYLNGYYGYCNGSPCPPPIVYVGSRRYTLRWKEYFSNRKLTAWDWDNMGSGGDLQGFYDSAQNSAKPAYPVTGYVFSSWNALQYCNSSGSLTNTVWHFEGGGTPPTFICDINGRPQCFNDANPCGNWVDGTPPAPAGSCYQPYGHLPYYGSYVCEVSGSLYKTRPMSDVGGAWSGYMSQVCVEEWVC